MSKKTTLSDLKASMSEIMIELGKKSDQVDDAHTIEIFRKRNAKAITTLTPQLLDLAFKRLASEVGSRKTRTQRENVGPDLFGDYHGIPITASIGKGKRQDFRKLSLLEGKKWYDAHSGSPEVDPERNKGVKQMIDDLEPYAVTGNETFEELVLLKAKALESKNGTKDG